MKHPDPKELGANLTVTTELLPFFEAVEQAIDRRDFEEAASKELDLYAQIFTRIAAGEGDPKFLAQLAVTVLLREFPRWG